jgi:hypothetical protein
MAATGTAAAVFVVVRVAAVVWLWLWWLWWFLGIRAWRRASRCRPTPVAIIVLIGAHRQLVIFVIPALVVREARHVNSARGSKFSRKPDKSCSVGAAKLVSHLCASACSAVRRRDESGFSSGRMKSFAVVPGPKVRETHSYMSKNGCLPYLHLTHSSSIWLTLAYVV